MRTPSLQFITPFILCLSLGLAAPAASQVISLSFDEIIPTNATSPAVSDEYSAQGVMFDSADDGVIWDGISKGDPGGWELEGTNGSAFLGFNGASYEMGASFDAPVAGFSLDTARAGSSNPEDTFTLLGYREGVLVEEVTVLHGDVNVWQTVELVELVDEVTWFGEEKVLRFGNRILARFPAPYGVDNVSWIGEEPASIEVPIDVKPGSSANRVKPKQHRYIRVTILGSEAMDADLVDPGSVRFGPDGVAINKRPKYKDVNRDGFIDLRMRFPMRESGLVVGDVEACLEGSTFDGLAFHGCDSIQTTMKPKRKHNFGH